MAIQIQRREFIVSLSGMAAWPLAARAQQQPMPVVAFLSARSADSDADLAAAIRRGLGETGYVEGKNLAIEYRWAEGQFDRLPALAAELVARQVAVIFASGGDIGVRAVKAATSAIPIVFVIGGDPVEFGLVASLNRPGGNATGVTVIASALWPKQLQLLRELIPKAATIAVLVNPMNPSAKASTRDLLAAGRAVGQKVLVLNISAEREFEGAFTMLAEQKAGALLVVNDPLFVNRREELVALARRHALPAMYDRREYVAAGGLMSYGTNLSEAYRQAGTYVGRILKGAKPAELPVVQPTNFELVINLKTARALGIEVSPTLLAIADEVIE